jgi:hypothetical protein
MEPLSTSLGGSCCILVFTDDYSRKNWTLFPKSKSETFRIFRSLTSLTKVEIGNKVNILRTDCRGIYLLNEFNFYCKEYGIKQELTQAFTPQQNGVSRKRNQTCQEHGKCMPLAKLSLVRGNLHLKLFSKPQPHPCQFWHDSRRKVFRYCS